MRLPSLVPVGTGAESTELRSSSPVCGLCVTVRGYFVSLFLCGIGCVADAVRRTRGAGRGVHWPCAPPAVRPLCRVLTHLFLSVLVPSTY